MRYQDIGPYFLLALLKHLADFVVDRLRAIRARSSRTDPGGTFSTQEEDPLETEVEPNP